MVKVVCAIAELILTGVLSRTLILTSGSGWGQAELMLSGALSLAPFSSTRPVLGSLSVTGPSITAAESQPPTSGAAPAAVLEPGVVTWPTKWGMSPLLSLLSKKVALPAALSSSEQGISWV